MYFADIHCHALAGVDDGAENDEIMLSMLDKAYADRIRVICFTPHWQPSVFGDNRKAAENAFLRAKEHISRRGYRMSLFLANELKCDMSSVSYLSSRACKPLNGSRNVLVDFSSNETADRISDGLYRLLGAGFRPVLAHTERYTSLAHQIQLLKELRLDGAKLQINADSILGKAGFGCRLRARKLLDEDLADLAASDSHGMKYRPSMLAEAYEAVRVKYGAERAKRLFWDAPTALLIPEN